MSQLTPLIELASQRSLDLFFRMGQGYLAQSVRQLGHGAGEFGLNPVGVKARAEARLVSMLPHVPEARQPYARPGI